MSGWLALPLGVRLACCALLGLIGGAAANWAAYRFSYARRHVGPWATPDPLAPPRRLCDRLPIVGWWGLRRESPLFGRGYWVRPLAVELLAAAAAAGLYWWEVERQGLLGRPVLAPAMQWALHLQWAAHLLLGLFMLAASLVDLDEKQIPDAITLPGTLAGLTLAAAAPWSLLPELIVAPGGDSAVAPVLLSSPGVWPAWLAPYPAAASLVVMLGCWWGWCLGLAPRTWYSRHGLRRAIALAAARAARERSTRWITALALVGSAGIAATWRYGSPHVEGLLSALVGMAATGGLVWLVRIVGTAALRKEAMGFGDVVLMGMIGAFLGWQAGLLTFFIAPFAGVVVGLATFVFRGEIEIPYGPFLCLAAGVVVVRWAGLWQWGLPAFSMGLYIPAVVVVGVAVMGLLLVALQRFKSLFDVDG